MRQQRWWWILSLYNSIVFARWCQRYRDGRVTLRRETRANISSLDSFAGQRLETVESWFRDEVRWDDMINASLSTWVGRLRLHHQHPRRSIFIIAFTSITSNIHTTTTVRLDSTRSDDSCSRRRRDMCPCSNVHCKNYPHIHEYFAAIFPHFNGTGCVHVCIRKSTE